MKFLYDFFPLILFFTAAKLYDIYVATAVAITASAVQVFWYYYRNKRFETMHLVTLGVLVVFGGMTLLLHDDTFIKWKPTIVNWIFSVILFGSHWIGNKTIIEHLLSKKIEMPAHVWDKLNMSWSFFFLLMGALNLYVAFYYRIDLDEQIRTDNWINFKVFGLTGLTFIFVIMQAMYMAKYMPEEKKT
ncbi:MAG: septation protein A [Acidiferrobacterales bacterium]